MFATSSKNHFGKMSTVPFIASTCVKSEDFQFHTHTNTHSIIKNTVTYTLSLEMNTFSSTHSIPLDPRGSSTHRSSWPVPSPALAHHERIPSRMVCLQKGADLINCTDLLGQSSTIWPTPHMDDIDHIISTPHAVEFSILRLFDELWRISLDRVQVGLRVGIRLHVAV